ncbi:MAG: FemAB family PEP-CTERM system-associated protein [Phycisphaeraceae bacterium]|nr:FemAB family PEP-CTERM system-associated protein [Phycisphaeraceae bacterium]
MPANLIASQTSVSASAKASGDSSWPVVEVGRELDSAPQGELAAFLSTADLAWPACPEHDPRWLNVLRQSLGHQPYFLIARGDPSPVAAAPGGKGREIRGYLPLALVQSRLFGRFLVSLPYLNRAGLVAADALAAAAMVDRAVQLADQLNVAYLELRHQGQALDHPALTHRRDEKYRMLLNLPASPEDLWNGLDAKVRNQIRKAQKSELTVCFGGQELLAEFYRIFSVNMRDLGTPVYSRRLFADMLAAFPEAAELAVVRTKKKEAAAAALLIHQSATAAEPACTQVPSASCLREFNPICANMWMYHQLLLRGMQRGSAAFDFGRSTLDGGTYRFKKQWGAGPQPTIWQYYLRRGDFSRMRPDHPGNQWKIALWQKLPVRVTQLLGPAIVRGIP